MSLEDTVNDGRRCGAPDALSYLLGILFFAPSPSEQTLMNVNAVESYLQMEKNLLVAIASPIRQTVKEKWSCRLPCISLHNPLFFLQTRVKSLLCCVWTSIMPLSVCVFLNPIRSSAELSSALRESVMYRAHFLDFNASTLRRIFFEEIGRAHV